MCLLLCIAALAVTAVTSVAGQCSSRSNGCSVVNGFPYKTEFTPACDRHDVCYVCGVKYGLSRLRCDDAFKADMQNICSSRSLSKSCSTYVDIYYSGVRAAGWLFYRFFPRKFCSESWIPDCLP